ncbi:hypothetical protein C4D60_Mb02t22570 [Musa balbisiana]|uniref:Uncharacterized protein n=1 Tax=Musa balbisiana TaxID=52838 RepID=A0A4S8IDZ1_MUSBA|nr:hypothetical protein C4D60_Mb02t22570 [Musa balbisiana]
MMLRLGPLQPQRPDSLGSAKVKLANHHGTFLGQRRTEQSRFYMLHSLLAAVNVHTELKIWHPQVLERISKEPIKSPACISKQDQSPNEHAMEVFNSVLRAIFELLAGAELLRPFLTPQASFH